MSDKEIGENEQENIREEDVINSKLENLKYLREQGVEPYKYSYQRTININSLRRKYENIGETESSETEKIAGRIMTLRGHGKICFGNLIDDTGNIQFYVRKDIIGEKEYMIFNKLDIGDIAGMEGKLFRTKTGEITIKVEKFEVLTKSLLPLPEKFHGLKDRELRYRKRYLDLMINEEVKKTFEIRTKIIKEIRNFLDERGFIEVETPMLHPIPGGAKARPFITHHNVLDMDLYLRIAPELYLKRLLVAGFEKVYEINRNFRNEGISIKHNPEFTMLELYAAYEDYSYVMQITEDMIVNLADKILMTRIIEYQGEKIDLNPPWKRISMKDAIKEYASIDVDSVKDEEIIKLLSKNEAIVIRDGITHGELITLVFEEFVEPKLIQPVFITDFPVEVSPLSKVSRKDTSVTERFEPYIFGREIGNGFSELNDPIDQEQRFKKQIEMDTQGEVSKVVDYDFIEALKYGMPPAGGLGVGIDRLVMFFTNSASIRDVILFPLLKPEKK
ncbi:MAG: lysine--tRNA ligase [Candidatus Goldbacteria bacterium]|nr:lysine--tRNA ligase [Candidatus Goldiibacteriota bacterium]